MKHVNIMGVPFIHTDQANFVELLDERIETKQKTFVVTANPEIVMKANEDDEFQKLINEATYITADGIGVVKAASLLKQPLPGRVTGFDTMMALLAIADKKHYKIYLLGATEDTLNKTVETIEKDYPGVEIAGSHHGFFDWEANTIADDVAATQPDMVFVALGAPRQEKWITENWEKFDHGIFIGVGGSFDGIAGTVPRAPVFWQKLNLEWFYRLLQQPSRWKRMLVLPRFALKILRLKMKGTSQ